MIIGDIYRHAAQTPDKAALIHNGVAWSYAEFAQRIEISRQHLAQQNLRPGSIAVLAIKHLADAWVHGIALHSLGVTTIPVPVARGIVDLSLRGIECVIGTQRESKPEVAAQAAAKGWKYLSLSAAEPPAGAAVPPLPQLAEPQGGHILMTSGTTGDYRMVLQDAAADASTLAMNARIRINGHTGDAVLYVGDFPLLTAGGWRWPMYGWNAGDTVVFHQGEHPLRCLLGGGITQALATPGTLAHLLSEPQGDLPRRDSMRLLVTGGPLPLVLAQAAQARLTRQVCTMLASTEASVLAITPIESPEDLHWHRIHPAREVQVVDEADRLLPADEVGLVRVRLLDGLHGYLDDPAASQQFFRNGYFYPGDLGVLSPDGRLALHGRVTDVINALGSKIATGPIEQALQDRFGAQGVCIFSIENARGEEEVHVAIQPGAPLQRQELEQVARKILGVFRYVHFHVVERLPRNHMGKVQRLALRQQLLAKKK